MNRIGATTLRGAHVQVGRQRIVLEFSGKSGVEHHVELRDPALARVLSDLIDASGKRGLVFASEDGAVVVDERRLNRYIEDNGVRRVLRQDFRTWGATSIVAGQLAAEIADSEDKGQLERAVRDAISVAADALANTVAVCRGSYVAPTVLDAFETGRLAPGVGDHPPRQMAQPGRADDAANPRSCVRSGALDVTG